MRALLVQFSRFGLVGLGGLLIDTAVVYALRGWLGLYGAGAAAYGVAASANWAANRAWTFADAPPAPAGRQWRRYVAANLAGFVVNRGTYAAMIWWLPAAAAYPVIAVGAGAAAGMGLNFVLARRIFLAT